MSAQSAPTLSRVPPTTRECQRRRPRRPRRRRSWQAIYCGVSVLLLAACAPFDLPPERLSSGDITLHTNVPVAFSTDLLSEWARERRAVGTLLGTPTSDDSEIDYGLFLEAAEVQRACSGAAAAAGGCAFGSSVATTAPFQQHELVHVFTDGRGRPHAFLAEGLAEVLGNEGAPVDILHDLALNRIGSSEAFRVFEPGSPTGYLQAASFVSFLIDTFGMSRFMALYECDDHDSDLADLDDVARDALGTTITAAHAQWVALPAGPLSALTRHVYECATPAATMGAPEAVRLVRGVSRGSGLSRGGAVRTLDVVASSTLRLHAEGPQPGVVVGSCDCRPDVLARGGDARVLDAEIAIEPGRYYVWLTGTFASADDAVLDAVLELALAPR